MNIVFMGTPDFAVPALVQLSQSSHHIQAVVTGIDKRRGRGNKLSPTPVKAKAIELDLPVIEVEDLTSSSFDEKLHNLNPDLFAVVAFRILPSNILKIPAKGSINIHASLLPKYRGAAPIHWAVMNGEKKTGCTVFMLDETVDTGEIIAQSATKIGANETTGDLYGRLKKQGAGLLKEAIDDIETDTFTSTPQNDEEATPAPKLFKDDCKIDFNQPAEEVHNMIRGLSPFPTAWAKLDDRKFNIYRSELSSSHALDPGCIAHKNGEMMVGCKSDSIVLKKVKIEGKREMSGNDFMNGYHGTGVLH